MPGSCETGSRPSALRRVPMAPIRCDGPKSRRSTRRQATFGQSNLFWVLQRRTAPRDTLPAFSDYGTVWQYSLAEVLWIILTPYLGGDEKESAMMILCGGVDFQAKTGAEPQRVGNPCARYFHSGELMARLYVMIGLPGAGKTTLARKIAAQEPAC